MRAECEARVDEMLDWLDLARVAELIARQPALWRAEDARHGDRADGLAALLMLDEPVAGLSAAEADHVRDTIRKVRERGISVVVIDHNMRFMAGSVRPHPGHPPRPGACARHAAGGADQSGGDRGLSGTKYVRA